MHGLAMPRSRGSGGNSPGKSVESFSSVSQRAARLHHDEDDQDYAHLNVSGRDDSDAEDNDDGEDEEEDLFLREEFMVAEGGDGTLHSSTCAQRHLRHDNLIMLPPTAVCSLLC